MAIISNVSYYSDKYKIDNLQDVYITIGKSIINVLKKADKWVLQTDLLVYSNKNAYVNNAVFIEALKLELDYSENTSILEQIYSHIKTNIFQDSKDD